MWCELEGRFSAIEMLMLPIKPNSQRKNTRLETNNFLFINRSPMSLCSAKDYFGQPWVQTLLFFPCAFFLVVCNI